MHVTAIYPYEPEETDELCIEKGDELYVLHKQRDGWWYGYHVSDPRNRGLFPSNFVRAGELSDTITEVRGDRVQDVSPDASHSPVTRFRRELSAALCIARFYRRYRKIKRQELDAKKAVKASESKYEGLAKGCHVNVVPLQNRAKPNRQENHAAASSVKDNGRIAAAVLLQRWVRSVIKRKRLASVIAKRHHLHKQQQPSPFPQMQLKGLVKIELEKELLERDERIDALQHLTVNLQNAVRLQTNSVKDANERITLLERQNKLLQKRINSINSDYMAAISQSLLPDPKSEYTKLPRLNMKPSGIRPPQASTQCRKDNLPRSRR